MLSSLDFCCIMVCNGMTRIHQQPKESRSKLSCRLDIYNTTHLTPFLWKISAFLSLQLNAWKRKCFIAAWFTWEEAKISHPFNMASICTYVGHKCLISVTSTFQCRKLMAKDQGSTWLVIWLVCGKISAIPFHLKPYKGIVYDAFTTYNIITPSCVKQWRLT